MAEHGTEASAEVEPAFDPLLDDARRAFGMALDAESRFAAIVERSGLGTEEAEVLAMVCAVDLDPDRQAAVSLLQGGADGPRPTLHLIRSLFGPEHTGALAVAEDGRLRRAGLVHVTVDRPWASRQVILHERVSWNLMGDDSLDPHLPPGTEVVASPEGRGDLAPLVLSVSADRIRRIQAAVVHAADDMFAIVTEPDDAQGWEALVRHATLAGLGVVLEVAGDALSPAARHWVERADHVTWAITSARELSLESLPRLPWIEVCEDDVAASSDEWSAVFGDAPMAGRRLTAHQLHLAARAAGGVRDPAAALRRLASGHLEQLARRVRPERTWDDLVLPGSSSARLHELVDRYRSRDLVHGVWRLPEHPSPGLVALFAGPSGTGKTMAAEIIAGSLGVDLFKVDVAAIVSKYIGETEKNLEAIFDASASSDLVLLFDEADALFGKRSEISDAKDRYANVEVSYLLQRLETFDGFVLLTTNLARNIDQAFLRRIHVTVEFPVPGPEDRRRIWERSLAEAPLVGVDLAEVAERFDLAGGSIRNAALTAAFLAARDERDAVGAEHVVQGVLVEFDKLGRLVDDEQFGPWAGLVRRIRSA